MSTRLYRCLAKATTAQGDQLKYGPNWALARRALLKVYDDHIECGDWRIEYSNIINATLHSFRSMFIPGFILKIETAEKTYHVGVNGNSFWRGELPFPVTREKTMLKYSAFSIAARIAVVGLLAYYIWTSLRN